MAASSFSLTGLSTSGVSSSTSSSSAPVSSVDVMGRKVWDKEHFARKAAEKLQEEDDDDDDEVDLTLVPDRKARITAYPPPSQRTHLKQRQDVLNLDRELGKSLVVTTQTPKQLQGGYWCDVCSCLIKDSQAYLDHVNGKRHNRLLGMTMRVERVGVSRVKEKLKQLKKAHDEAKDAALGQSDANKRNAGEDSVEDRLQALRQQDEERRQRKRERKKLKKKLTGGSRGILAGDEVEKEEREQWERKRMRTRDPDDPEESEDEGSPARYADDADVDHFVLAPKAKDFRKRTALADANEK